MDKAQLLLRLPKAVKESIEKIADEKGISTTGLILIILHQYTERRKAQ